MKTWVVRFASLYAFNLIVLWLVGLLLPAVHVGWSAFWASIILTAGTIWVRPAISSFARKRAAASAGQRTKLGDQVVQGAIVFVVAAVVWVLTVMLSGVQVRGFFWGWVIPPVALLIAWAIYAAVDSKIEARAGDLYDKAMSARGGAKTPVATTQAAPTAPSAEEAAGRRELHDGLTDEQRKMLDELGS